MVFVIVINKNDWLQHLMTSWTHRCWPTVETRAPNDVANMLLRYHPLFRHSPPLYQVNPWCRVVAESRGVPMPLLYCWFYAVQLRLIICLQSLKKQVSQCEVSKRFEWLCLIVYYVYYHYTSCKLAFNTFSNVVYKLTETYWFVNIL